MPIATAVVTTGKAVMIITNLISVAIIVAALFFWSNILEQCRLR
jgi:hypothetical protein